MLGCWELIQGGSGIHTESQLPPSGFWAAGGYNRWSTKLWIRKLLSKTYLHAWLLATSWSKPLFPFSWWRPVLPALQIWKIHQRLGCGQIPWRHLKEKWVCQGLVCLKSWFRLFAVGSTKGKEWDENEAVHFFPMFNAHWLSLGSI